MATTFPGGLSLAIPAPDCVPLNSSGGELCIFMPGGATICASLGYDTGDPLEVVKSLLAQVNAALAPLQPFFNVLDVLKALVDCIKAIPDCLGPPPSPGPIIECLKGLAEAFEKLVELFPPISIFKMVKSIIGAIIQALTGLKNNIQALADQIARIANAATAAATLGNLDLKAIAQCAQDNLDVQLQNLNASLAPLNRLIGIVNLFLKLAGLPCVPTVGDIASGVTDALDVAIQALTAVYNVIPVSLDLDGIPDPDEPC